MQPVGAEADHGAGQQQAGADAEVDQAAGAGAVVAYQPFEDQRRGLDEHQAVADAVEQAQGGEQIGIAGLGLQQGGQRMQHQPPGQAAANLGDAVPADRQQGAEQVAEVVPAGDVGPLPEREQAILDQPRQQGRVDEAAEGMHGQ
ncbi:hypothetical protein D3C72_1819160 [compost metagenome]